MVFSRHDSQRNAPSGWGTKVDLRWTEGHNFTARQPRDAPIAVFQLSRPCLSRVRIDLTRIRIVQHGGFR